MIDPFAGFDYPEDLLGDPISSESGAGRIMTSSQ
jgi:hypothetical protein